MPSTIVVGQLSLSLSLSLLTEGVEMRESLGTCNFSVKPQCPGRGHGSFGTHLQRADWAQTTTIEREWTDKATSKIDPEHNVHLSRTGLKIESTLVSAGLKIESPNKAEKQAGTGAAELNDEVSL